MLHFAIAFTIPFAFLMTIFFALVDELNWLTAPLIWVQTFLLVYCAVWLLSRRDRATAQATIGRMKARLEGDIELSDEEFLSPHAEHPELLLKVRDTVAEMLGICSAKALRHEPFLADMPRDSMEPWFTFKLLTSVLPSHQMDKSFKILPTTVESLDQLTIWLNEKYLSK